MSLDEPSIPEDEAQHGQASHADHRMADILGDKDRTRGARERLKEEGSEEAEDLIGRLHAMDFIDDVIGDDHQMPRKIGDFDITGVLGRGGMGTVYKAYQDSLDREVALKVLAPRFSSDVTMRKRFRKEAKATAAMHHRHIVPIFDYGEASGLMFFAMECVDGVSLDKHIAAAHRKNSVVMTPLDAARRFAGVADALALAHNRQMLHRDVKPGNVLVNEDGTLALADFGLSKFLGEASVHLTSVGGFLGTLHYSPPEQARGEVLGPASDLYSLGVTIYECITGHLPIKGDSTEAMLQALLNEEAPRLRHYLPKASRDLEAVLEKLLSKRPDDRYQNGEALALDLIRVAEGEPIRIRRQNALIRVYRRAKRNPVMTLAISAGLILLIVLGLFFDSLQDNRLFKGRESLAQASGIVSREPGLALGPHGVVSALSGLRFQEVAETSAFLRQLDLAARRLPDEVVAIDRYRTAYRGGVLGESDLIGVLKSGNGKAALGILTPLIEGRRSVNRDVGVEIDLYNLHLARAIVYLSASIADPSRASSDLDIAKYIRPGAFLPRVLATFLKHRNSPNQLVEDLSEFLDKPLLRRSTAEFMIAFAGIGSPATAHLMRFPLSYETRKRFTETAVGWLDGIGDYEIQSNGGYTGLSRALVNGAIPMLNNSGNAVLVNQSMAAARDIFDDMLGADSALIAWQFTYQLLGGDVVPEGTLSERARINGGIHFIRLVQRLMTPAQGEALLSNLSSVIRPLLGDPSRDTGPEFVELRARYESLVGNQVAAMAATDAWLKLDETNPEAQLSAFCALVRQGPTTELEMVTAMTPGAEALQLSLDRKVMSQLLQSYLESQLSRGLGAEVSRKWLVLMLQSIRVAENDG